MAKIRNFDSFGDFSPHIFALRSAPPCQISRLSKMVMIMMMTCGEKPIFGPLSKNNTGMAALNNDLNFGN